MSTFFPILLVFPVLIFCPFLASCENPPVIYAPPKSFGIADLTLTPTTYSSWFCIVDSAYFHPFGNCSINLLGTQPGDPADPLNVPFAPLHVLQSCNPATYQYRITAWTSPLNFSMDILHTYMGSTYTNNHATLVRNGTFAFQYLAATEQHSGGANPGSNSSAAFVTGSDLINAAGEKYNNISIDAALRTVSISFLAAPADQTNVTLAPKGWNGDVLAPGKDSGRP